MDRVLFAVCCILDRVLFAIFYDDKDRKIFLKYITITKKDYNYSVYAYCLMDNHVHMVIKAEKEFLSKAIQSLQIRYVQYFNNIHRNPEKAKISKTEEYKWSSYKEYIGKEKIIDKKILLYYLNNDINQFVKYTTQNNDDEILKKFAEYEIIPKLTDSQLISIIMKLFNIEDLQDIPMFFKNREKSKIEENIKEIKKIGGTNKTQVARITRIGRWSVNKIWNL